MKKIKLNLVLAFALLSGASAVYSIPAAIPVNGAKAALEAVGGLSVVQAVPETPAPMVAAAADAFAAGQQAAPSCEPNPDIAPGTELSPKIENANHEADVRVATINDLLAKIAECRPLPYSHDGITFTNKEGTLPRQSNRDYYKEFTLMVPGRQTGDGPVPVFIGGKQYMTGKMLSARGPERIIIGGRTQIYYTPDHYATFIELKIVK
ncbi:MAG: ribonuclease domain-containing protein [Elusimicrobiales bacterium]|nr:ribonuclease domain-containing protein [Elusimicrobiales bacterium]